MSHDEANDDLERKPDVADAFDVEECQVRFFSLFFHLPSSRLARPRVVGGRRRASGVVVVVYVKGDVAQDGHPHAVVCL